MFYILVGAAAFLILYWVDFFAVKRIPLLKPLFWLAGSALFGYALFGVCLSQPRFTLPLFVRICGGCIAAVSLSMLVFSLFIEIPFRETYTLPGADQKLVTDGTYALVRHPGVLWQVGLLTGLVLLTGSLALLLALPLWTALNLLYVFIQEKFFFPRMFGQEYRRYQLNVPMIVPTSASIRACLRTFIPAKKSTRRQT